MKSKLKLPKGAITIRHRQMRNVFQCFAGRTYIPGASGDTASDAAESLSDQYEVPGGTIATVHGYRQKSHIVF